MQYFIEGGGSVDITDRDFLAEGGEGRLYAKNDRLFKIYHDPQQALSSAKLQELNALNHPSIIRPQALLLNRKNQAVGFWMSRIAQAVPLPRLFTNDFRQRHQIGNRLIIDLVENMRETIAYIHARRCLIVDGNEMNYLVTETDFRTPYFIDVDSWQTPGFSATAIMPTIRDYHTQGFSALTDWFAFGIVACQLFVGIHPYKGGHPNFKKHDLEARMRANISIFNADTTLPGAARDLDSMPAVFKDWLIALFEQGERLPAPSLKGASIAPIMRKKVIQGTDNFVIDRLREFDAPIQFHSAWHGLHTVHTHTTLYAGKQSLAIPDSSPVIVYSPRQLLPLACAINTERMLQIHRLDDGTPLNLTLRAERLLLSDNTLYALYRDKLTEIRIQEYGDKLLAAAGQSWSVLPEAAQVLTGMVYESVLGKPYLVIPWQPNACTVQEVPALAGYKIVDGKHDKGVAILIGYSQNGHYDRLIVRFNKDYTQHDVRITSNLDQPSINFVTLDNGVVVQYST